MRERRTVALVLAFCVVGLPSGCFRRDPGRELVNAAGLSTTQVLVVLAKGADINRQSSSTFGWTPLISAIYHKKADVAELLIARGADVNVADSASQTPLNWTIQTWNDNTNLIELLIRRGADPTIKSRFGSDAFELADKQPNSEEILRILKQAPAHKTGSK